MNTAHLTLEKTLHLEVTIIVKEYKSVLSLKKVFGCLKMLHFSFIKYHKIRQITTFAQ